MTIETKFNIGDKVKIRNWDGPVYMVQSRMIRESNLGLINGKMRIFKETKYTLSIDGFEGAATFDDFDIFLADKGATP